jgi:invasion protein IalB
MHPNSPGARPRRGPSALIYSAWIKFCGGEICFISKDGRSAIGCEPHVTATLIARRGEAAATLRITVPADVDAARGLRIRIDQGAAIERPDAGCALSGCMAEISGADLVDRLKQGHMLVAEAADAGPSPVAFSLPLDGFAAAYDGPSMELKVFESQPGQLAKELQQQKEPRAQAQPSAPCSTK